MLLKVKNLTTQFQSDDEVNIVVNNISFNIPEEKIICIVGESGSGKTITSLSLLGLIEKPGKIQSGSVIFEGDDIINSNKLKGIRGNKISMIFQEAMSSLNPSYTIGFQIDEVLKLHQKHLNKKQRYKKVIQALEIVKMPFAREKYNDYPHKLSGGQAQRAMIAMAMACEPKLLIADEPTTALDVTIQEEILRLIKELRDSRGTSVLFITHDLSVVSQIADEVIVMYKGHIVEKATTKELFEDPRHPYTKALLSSIPIPDITKRKSRLKTIDPNINYLDYKKEIR